MTQPQNGKAVRIQAYVLLLGLLSEVIEMFTYLLGINTYDGVDARV